MSLWRFSSLLNKDFAAKYVLMNNEDKMMSGKYRAAPTDMSMYHVLCSRSTNPTRPAMASPSIQIRPRTIVGFLKLSAAIATFALYKSRSVSRNTICICAGAVEIAMNKAITTVPAERLRARTNAFYRLFHASMDVRHLVGNLHLVPLPVTPLIRLIVLVAAAPLLIRVEGHDVPLTLQTTYLRNFARDSSELAGKMS